MAQPEEVGDQASSKKKGGIIVPIAAVIIILLLIIVILLLIRGNGGNAQNTVTDITPPPEPTLRSTVVTQDNVEAIVEEMEQAEFVEPGYYTVTMENTWHFARGDAVSYDAYVENLMENTNDVYFDVILAEDEETTILASPVIPRGSYWDEISLDTPLEAGTYDCVMIYHLIDEGQNTVSTLRVGLTIIVEN